MDEQNNRNLLKQAILDGIGQRYEELSATEEIAVYSKKLDREMRRLMKLHRSDASRTSRIKRALVAILIAAAFLFVGCSVTVVSYFAGSVRGTVIRVTADGKAEFDIMPQKLLEEVGVGDTATVKIGSFREEMPLTEELVPEEGKLQLLLDKENQTILLCGYNEDVCEKYDIRVGDRVIIRKSKN